MPSLKQSVATRMRRSPFDELDDFFLTFVVAEVARDGFDA
jgi:hypothetical protein